MLPLLHEIIVAAKALGEDLKAVSGVITLLSLMLNVVKFLVEVFTKEENFAF